MKMFILVYGSFLADEIHTIFSRLGIKGYSEIPKLFGTGELGTVADSRYGPGHNSSIFAAVAEEKVPLLMNELKGITDRNESAFGRPLPLRAFVMPCEQVV